MIRKKLNVILCLFILITGFGSVAGEDLVSTNELSTEQWLISTGDLINPAALEIGSPKGNNYHKSNSIIISDDETFSCPFRPKEDMPELEVSFTKLGELYRGTVFPMFYLYLCTLSKNGEDLQTFELISLKNLDFSDVYFTDLDSDGYLDMSIIFEKAIKEIMFIYYGYNADSNCLEEIRFSNDNIIDVELFSEPNQIITKIGYYETDYMHEKRELFQYSTDVYTLIREEFVYSMRSKPKIYEICVTEYYEDDTWQEIYSAILTEDEYYGDLTVRDNYLRFGTKDAP